MRIFYVGQEVFIFYADMRSRSMSCNCMTRTSQQECRGILELLIGFNFAMEFYLKYTLLINCQD